MMDDLLKVFLAETSQSLEKSEANLAKLRTSPDDSAAVADMLQLVRSIREECAVMGLPQLQAAAALGVEAVHAMQGDDPAAVARMAPTAANRLAQIRHLINSLEHAADKSGPNLSSLLARDTMGPAFANNSTEPLSVPAGSGSVLAVKRPKLKKVKDSNPAREARSLRQPANLAAEADNDLSATPTPPRRSASSSPVAGASAVQSKQANPLPAIVGGANPRAPIEQLQGLAPNPGALRPAPARRLSARRHGPRLRTILLAVGGPLVAAAAAIAVVFLTLDVEAWGQIITAEVEAATGRRLTINGELGLGFSLTPTVIANDVALANMATGSRPEMIIVRRLEVQFELLPLLEGEVRIKRLVLVGGDILLERDPKGRANWQFGETDNSDRATVGVTAAAPSTKSALPSVSDLVFQDTQFTYRGGGSGESHSLLLNRLSARADSGVDPITIEIAGSVNSQSFTFAGRMGPGQALLRNAATTLDLAGEIAGNALSVKGQLAQPLDAKGLQLSISAVGPTLASLGPAFGINLPNLGPYEFAATVSDPNEAYRFDALKARLNQSNIAGELAVRLDGLRPRLDGQLTSTLLDLADFAERGGDGASAASDDGRLFSNAPLPVHLLAAADGAVRLTADRFVAGRFALQATAVDVSLADGRLDFTSLSGGYSGGSVVGTGLIEPSDAGAVWHLDLQARQVVAGDLLRDLFGSTALSGGLSDLTFKLRSQGNSVRQLMAALDGTASLNMVGGRINDDLVNVALAGTFKTLTLAGGGDGGQVNCAVAQLAIADGIAQSRRMVADLRGATIVGGGRIDLRNETIAMRFAPASKRTSLATFAGPFDVVGPLAEPNVGPDAAATAMSGAGAAASVATVGIADSIAGLAGVNLTNKSAAGASCAPATDGPKSTSTQKAGAGTSSAKKNTSPTKTESSGGLLDDVNAGFQNLFDGSAPTNNKTSKSRGSKDSH
jgi:uncharacterized protein involved in outer membrane biogenesis/HPt (histidine-containing phosphotransfer) domain-containing protein